MNLEIELEFNPDHFKEIYFKDRNGNYVLSSTTRLSFIMLIISGLLFLLIALYQRDKFIYVSISMLFFLCWFWMYLASCFSLFKWKNGVYKFISETGRFKKHTYTLLMDDIEHTVKWDTVNSVKTTPEYISLEAEASWMIPMKSVGHDSFQKIKEFVAERVNK